jgi:acyl CoA:acetate/3-ketoacid CoA transferase beta subunit
VARWNLAIGAKDAFVMMTLFGKDGVPKLVPTCTYPLTGAGCVSRVYTDHGIFEVGLGPDPSPWSPPGASASRSYGPGLT